MTGTQHTTAIYAMKYKSCYTLHHCVTSLRLSYWKYLKSRQWKHRKSQCVAFYPLM